MRKIDLKRLCRYVGITVAIVAIGGGRTFSQDKVFEWGPILNPGTSTLNVKYNNEEAAFKPWLELDLFILREVNENTKVGLMSGLAYGQVFHTLSLGANAVDPYTGGFLPEPAIVEHDLDYLDVSLHLTGRSYFVPEKWYAMPTLGFHYMWTTNVEKSLTYFSGQKFPLPANHTNNINISVGLGVGYNMIKKDRWYLDIGARVRHYFLEWIEDDAKPFIAGLEVTFGLH